MPSPAEAPRSRFELQGRSWRADPRIDAVRRDLADVRLAGRIFAPHYSRAEPLYAVTASPVRAARAKDSPVLSEILPGERFELLELSSEYGWGICVADGSVGYVAAAALSETAPDVSGATDSTTDKGSDKGSDFVAIAEAQIGAPAKPGGRSPAGFNCTGLVFYALAGAGRQCPRFCDLQRSQLGSALAEDAALERSDLIFFDDHVAIMVDGDNAVHVTAKEVVREPLADICTSGSYGDIVARRRMA